MNFHQYQTVQRASFNALVDQGVYSEAFEHPLFLKRFFAQVLSRRLPLSSRQRPVQVLDCGCGSGVWLLETDRLIRQQGMMANLYGFDIADSMVDLTRHKLAEVAAADHFQRGDLLDPAAYRFNTNADSFDLVYAFDAVQQLPPVCQFECCVLMLARTRPGGCLILFDHDADSSYGRRMARKKFLTRYLGLPLVPRYYCNAHYPPLRKFAQRLDLQGFNCEVIEAHDSPKMALVAWRVQPETSS